MRMCWYLRQTLLFHAQLCARVRATTWFSDMLTGSAVKKQTIGFFAGNQKIQAICQIILSCLFYFLNAFHLLFRSSVFHGPETT